MNLGGFQFKPMTPERRRELFLKMQAWARSFLRIVLATHRKGLKSHHDHLVSKLDEQEVENLRVDTALLQIHAKTQQSAIKTAYHEMYEEEVISQGAYRLLRQSCQMADECIDGELKKNSRNFRVNGEMQAKIVVYNPFSDEFLAKLS